MKKLHSALLSLAITAAAAVLYFYLALPAINLRSGGFWFMIIAACAVFAYVYAYFRNPKFLAEMFERIGGAVSEPKKKRKPGDIVVGEFRISRRTKKILIAIAAILIVFMLVCAVTSARLFRATDYRELLTVETDADFASDIAELPLGSIPVVDRDTAARLGSRKLGEVVALVSQFNVSSYYSQINYGDKPVRVSPLEYADILKWFSNKDDGIPYYVYIDMATQETRLVELDEGMRYSPSEYFGRDLTRHIRFAYPTRMIEEISFEIDDSGAPFWVVSYYDYTIGLFGGKDTAGIILVDAVSGEMTDYSIADVPRWIDRAYSAELLVSQANDWGSLKNGFWNSIFIQKDVVVTTEGYNYIAINDDVWLYTGITSVSADESNIGFILINMRTKEAKTYMINGAEEYSAMESAEGQVQEKGYSATFPILINVADRPSYFISLKDNAGLVKMYAFVSVANYQIVGVADTIDGAKKEYMRMLGETGDDTSVTTETVSGTVQSVATAVVDGNSVYYIMLNGNVYTAEIRISSVLPFLKEGVDVEMRVLASSGRVESITVLDAE